jgi:hypothetical protein
MKFKPTTPSKPQREKTKYIVTIEDEEYQTSAYTEEAALSNAAYRYADEVDEDVALVKWKIKHDKLYFNVEEVTPT